MTDTARLKLPLLAAGQAQKHVTHNEALIALDALVQMRLGETGRNAPPASPAEGDAFGVGPTPSGAWSGKADTVAVFTGGVWKHFTPDTGWIAWRASDAALVVRVAGGWSSFDTLVKRLGSLAAVGIGTAENAGTPLSVKGPAVLFASKSAAEGGTGDLRVTFNKSVKAATVSQIYQTNWSGRAETGLTGDDVWRLKVSADGTQWTEALAADPATGAVRIDALISGRAAPAFGARIEAGFAGASPGMALVDGSTSGNGSAIVFRRGTALVGAITVSATGTVYATTSDHRVKTEIAALDGAAERVRRLRPCRFEFVGSPGVLREGFIAHEAAEVVPEAVTGEKDAVDEHGAPVLQAIDLSRLVPLLTACVQELTARVDALERRIV